MRPDRSDSPGITVIVPTLERDAVLVDCLTDLLAQSHHRFEILVVDQSTIPHAGAIALARCHPDILRYVHVQFRSLPEARNYGWMRARYETVIFVDDDVRCDPELLVEHGRALLLPGVGIVAGAIDDIHQKRGLKSPGAFHAWTATAPPGFSATGECDVDRAGGGNLSAWVDVLAEAGGFDETLGAGAALFEEVDLCLRVKRLGYRVYFNGRARLTHLAVPFGGVRTRSAHAYLYAMARNRSIVIRRHVRWYQMPFALSRSLLYGLSIARAQHAPGALWGCIQGIVSGLRRGGEPPRCVAGGTADTHSGSATPDRSPVSA